MDRAGREQESQGKRWWQDWRWVASVAALVGAFAFSVFTINSVLTRTAVTDQGTEAECRSDLAGEFDDAMFLKLDRIEQGLVAVARGDDTGLLGIAEQSDARREIDEEIRQRRAEAVAICGGS